jgi:hypothetical protein
LVACETTQIRRVDRGDARERADAAAGKEFPRGLGLQMMPPYQSLGEHGSEFLDGNKRSLDSDPAM